MPSLSRAVYGGLAVLRAPHLLRRLRGGAPVFCFHNVVLPGDSGVGDASLHMPVPAFEAVAGWIGASYDVVPLGALVDRAASGRGVRGLAAVTFDDAYRGVFEHALPVLAKLGMPATLFVVSRFPEAPTHTWWDTLGGWGLLSEERRHQALSVHHGLAEEVLSAVIPADRAGVGLPEVMLPASWDRILQAASDGVEVGSHSARHPNLVALEGKELDEEMNRSYREIAERTGKAPDAIAYPYGLWNGGVATSAARAGYRVGLALGGRLFTHGQDPLAIPRINVPAGISRDALACWATGIRPRRPW